MTESSPYLARSERPATRAQRPLRVLQLGKYYAPYRGGIEHHLQMLCGELSKRSDIELDVVVCDSRPAHGDGVVDGVRVKRCFEVTKIASTSICPTMPVEIARREYDIVHLHFPHPMGVASYFLGRRSRPHAVVIAYHSDIVRQKRLLRAYRPIMNLALARADAIIAATDAYADSSDVLAGFRDKVHVIPYGLDLAQTAVTPTIARGRDAIRAKHAGRKLVLGVGRLVYYKGFEYLVRAMRDVDADLLLVGDGPLRASLEQIAREAGVADRIDFMGEIDETTLRAAYAACDVFALSSIERSEAFAIVQLEAMAHAKPVVNTDIPGSGVAWVSRDGESGLTVTPKDASALAGALRRVLDDPTLAARLGQGGRARAHREFSQTTMAERTHALYRSLMPR